MDQKQQDINFHLGPNFHVVTYPINEKKTSFVAAVKKNKKHEESWYAKGTYDDLKEDIPQEILMKYKDEHIRKLVHYGEITRQFADKNDKSFFDNGDLQEELNIEFINPDEI